MVTPDKVIVNAVFDCVEIWLVTKVFFGVSVHHALFGHPEAANVTVIVVAPGLPNVTWPAAFLLAESIDAEVPPPVIAGTAPVFWICATENGGVETASDEDAYNCPTPPIEIPAFEPSKVNPVVGEAANV